MRCEKNQLVIASDSDFYLTAATVNNMQLGLIYHQVLAYLSRLYIAWFLIDFHELQVIQINWTFSVEWALFRSLNSTCKVMNEVIQCWTDSLVFQKLSPSVVSTMRPLPSGASYQQIVTQISAVQMNWSPLASALHQYAVALQPFRFAKSPLSCKSVLALSIRACHTEITESWLWFIYGSNY